MGEMVNFDDVFANDATTRLTVSTSDRKHVALLISIWIDLIRDFTHTCT